MFSGRRATPTQTPEQRAQAAAAQAQVRAEQAWVDRLARIALERKAADEAQEAAEREVLAAELQRRAAMREAILEHVARHGHYFPGDRLDGPRDRWERLRWRHPFAARVLDALFGG